MELTEVKEIIHSHLDQAFDKVVIREDTIRLDYIIIDVYKNGKEAHFTEDIDTIITEFEGGSQQDFCDFVKFDLLQYF